MRKDDCMTLANWVLVAGTLAGLLTTAGCSCFSHDAGYAATGSLKPDTLRVEYRKEPLGIGEQHPRFSWTLSAKDPAARAQAQSAYQILVSSSKSKPTGDIWDTGRVASDATAQVAYDGQPLLADHDYFWTVKVWDTAGHESSWSPVQRFSVGLLAPGDWTAQWIGYDAPWKPVTSADPSTSLAGINWIWFPEGDPLKDAPAASRFFRKTFTLPADRKVRSATITLAADNSATAYVDGHTTVTASDFLTSHSIDVTSHLKPGQTNIVAVEAKNTGGPAGLAAKLTIHFETGNPMTLAVDDTWKSSTKSPAGWKGATFDDSSWHNAKVIAKVGDAPWGTPTAGSQLVLPPTPYLRSVFSVHKPVKRAMAYASALGLYELRLNGTKVGHYELTPGWEDYRHRVYYNTYDLTKEIEQGDNAIGVLLGDGWYDGYVGYTGKRHTYLGDPRARVQINIEYTDGTTQTVSSDNSWRATYGPIREADLLMGCTYDATLDKTMKGWDTVVYDDSKWHKVATGTDGPFNIPCQAYIGDPTIRHETLHAKKITVSTPGAYVFDLGQNMVGWAHFKLKGKQGQKITFRYTEMLNPDGTLYTTALRSARATDAYTPAADGTFEWEPHFTFHGFRYVEIAGLDAKPDLDAVTGVVIGADMPRTGYIETSNPLVNQLVHNIIWGQKGNYLEIPTDCPQRDERLGWTGDAQFFVRTGCYNFDISAFFDKWLIDLVSDSQMPDGGFTHVAPAVVTTEGGATAWQDASVICTYAMYKFYGDTRNIERHWDHLTRFMDYLHNTSHDFIRNDKPFGDWLNQGASAKSEVTGTAYYAYVSHLMSEMAAALGHNEQSKQYAELADQIREKWQKEFLKPDGSILESSQTGFALAFTMNLLPENLKAAAAKQFAEEVRKRDWHLGTGFIGTPRLLPGLQAAGETDVAYKLLLQDTFPSWLFQVKLGATTMWERWDGYRPDKGFQDPGMNSFNHYAFGSVGEWMYSSMVGIDQADAAFKHIIIRPHPGGAFTHVNGRYDSINGPIVSHWSIEGTSLKLHVEIPVNTTATIYVPGNGPITESGKPVESSPNITFVRQDGDAMVYQVGSGHYDFVSTYK
ncbi:MAG TPA: family 78 glycoside hydrolase catalytic domain [Tepidisphaeraceae bacterium]|jgi:alpha-L-rhamnosidase|nr:family 78 glycoside hydrolase catalytic domain [Tepidisphaeraceae bacterium]